MTRSIYRRPVGARGGGRYTEPAPPMVPHGERGENSEIEDTLPRPRCAECLDRIYYEQGAWHHAEIVLDHEHEAGPEVWVGRNFRKNHLTTTTRYGRIIVKDGAK